MALLNILQFPDSGLKLKASPVSEFNDEIHQLIENMFDTLYEAHGVGLAATQVNVQKRVIVIDVSHEQSQPLCIINPEIKVRHGIVNSEEGCLSFPGVYAQVQRSEKIEVEFLDKAGVPQQLKAEGLLAICIQHEMDHLEGITFYDRLSSLKQQMLRKKLEKIRRRAL